MDPPVGGCCGCGDARSGGSAAVADGPESTGTGCRWATARIAMAATDGAVGGVANKVKQVANRLGNEATEGVVQNL